MKRESIFKKFLSVFLATGLILTAESGLFTGSTIAYDEQSQLLNQVKKDTQETKVETEKEIKTMQELQNQYQQNLKTETRLENAPIVPLTGELKSITTDNMLQANPPSLSVQTQNNLNVENVTENEVAKEIKSPSEGNIYPWLPSMMNIYKGQVEQKTNELQLFGNNIFNRDSTLMQSMVDVPVGNDYVVGVGDTLQITIWGSLNTAFEATVTRDGNITLPEVGTFYVAGRNFGTLKKQIGQKLNEIFKNVSVDVSLGKLRTIKVYVMGEAANPGSYDVSSISTAFHALFRAGGPSPIGSLRNIDIIRDNKVVKKIDMYDFLLRGDKSSDIRLQNGDTIFFRLRGRTVGVDGLVNRPAIYEIKNEKNLNQIMNLSGGFVPTSYLKKVQVKRINPNKDISLLNLDLSKVNPGNVEIKDKDIVRVFPILPIDKQTVYLSGHVFRPGTYEYKKNMKLSEVITSYSDLLPEPHVEYAQVVRLQEPDLKPYTIMFNLGELLNKKIDIDLKPFDTVMVFSRWTFTRVPEAEVTGEVFKPGKFKIIKGTKLIDLLKHSEGFTKNAYLERAEIIRKIDGNGNKQTFSVNLEKALQGDLNHNLEIKDEDVIIVHGIKDIMQDKFVTLLGNVTKPGQYPLGKGMKVKDLVNLGGNVNKSAYMDEAELVSYYVTGTDVIFETKKINLKKAVEGDPEHNLSLKDMDRLIVKQIPKWEDVGMTVTIKGEVKYPGVYAASPDETIGDLIERAGGFLDSAYLTGVAFYRDQAKESQQAHLKKLIADMEQGILTDTTSSMDIADYLSSEQLALRRQNLQFRKQLLETLKSTDVTGRIVLDMKDYRKFRDSETDVKLMNNDMLVVPKTPAFVSVLGEVYYPTSIVFQKGKKVGFYLSQAGGVTPDAEKGRVFVVKANGSIISSEGKWFYNINNEVLEPGDSILVPQITEKLNGFELAQTIVDIAYKTAVAAGVFLRN